MNIYNVIVHCKDRVLTVTKINTADILGLVHSY